MIYMPIDILHSSCHNTLVDNIKIAMQIDDIGHSNRRLAMNKTRFTHKNRSLLILVIAVTAVILWLPSQLLAYSYDFQGTVLYDSHVGSTGGAGFGQAFTGSFSTDNGGSLMFNRDGGSSVYNNPSPGDFLWGGFTQGGVDFFYAYGSGGNDPEIRMGAIWWSQPPNSTMSGIYGVAFHLEGDHFTPGDLIARRLAGYLFDSKAFNVPLSIVVAECRPVAGEAFLGIFTDNQLPAPPPPSPSQVPLPAAIWFLGSGLLVIWRRLKAG